jgi:diacylglycerol kinase (CTP)
VASPVFSDAARCTDELASALALLITSDADVEATTSAVLNGAHTTYTQPRDRVDYDRYSLLVNAASICARTRSSISGLIRVPPLPFFTTCFRSAMASSRQYQIPHTPRVISPSPTPSEAGSGKDGYFPPVTRASARKNKLQSPPPIEEDSSGSDPEKRARTRSRDPTLEGGMGRRRVSGLTTRRQQNGGIKKDLTLPNGTSNGHLSPAAANKNYWREMSRSPSPLGLIPIHQEWRSFVRSADTLLPWSGL